VRYSRLKENYNGGLITADHTSDVALLSNLVNGLKKGKAVGLDDVTAKHLKFSHPIKSSNFHCTNTEVKTLC
jgi:hypothetical protein